MYRINSGGPRSAATDSGNAARLARGRQRHHRHGYAVPQRRQHRVWDEPRGPARATHRCPHRRRRTLFTTDRWATADLQLPGRARHAGQRQAVLRQQLRLHRTRPVQRQFNVAINGNQVLDQLRHRRRRRRPHRRDESLRRHGPGKRRVTVELTNGDADNAVINGSRSTRPARRRAAVEQPRRPVQLPPLRRHDRRRGADRCPTGIAVGQRSVARSWSTAS